MTTLLKSKSLNYSDVNLIAQPGVVESRMDIPLEGWRIVVSAMTSIIGPTFIEAVAELPEAIQPTLHIPRDTFALSNIAIAKECNLKNIFVGVGLNNPEIEELAMDYNYKTVLLDVANGYAPNVIKKVVDLKSKGFKVCTGSVHTWTGKKELMDAGCDIVRSGIGPGSVCITSDSTGYTRGTFTEINELSDPTNKTLILADGGFRAPSDLLKAWLAGASYCMTGRLFVEAKECRMHSDGYRGLYKQIPMHTYFGMASEYGKIAMGKEVRNIEGKMEETPETTDLTQILVTVWQAIRSGISYSGCPSLTDAIGKGVFEEKA